MGYDPLTLDLDGDGLETTGINASAPILFDHNADGVKTATGWVKPDDALLVYDRNGNGRIDSGRELFGDSTLSYSGGTTADGFAALAQEDTNGDGRVNAADAHWTSLRLWRDLNQDGISQADELFTLDSQNITALNVAKTANSQMLANGNQIADLGSYVKTDGSVRALGEVTGMGDINLAGNPFYREFTDHIPLTDTAATLPAMHGSGMVRDLQEAASLDASLITLVQGCANLTRTQMLSQIDTLLARWANTSTFKTSMDEAAGRSFRIAYLPPAMNSTDFFAGAALTGGTGSGTGSGGAVLVTGDAADRLDELNAQQAHIQHMIGILERFNGLLFVNVEDDHVTTGRGGTINAVSQPAGSSSGGGGATIDITPYAFVTLNAGQVTLLEQSYAQLKDSVYGGLVLQTRLKPYMDAINLTIDENGIALDFSGMEAANDLEWRTAA